VFENIKYFQMLQVTHSVLCRDALMSRMQEYRRVNTLYFKLHLWEHAWLYKKTREGPGRFCV